nr:ABC transporter ATP-binding protein [Polycladospora coralii]
MLKSKYTFFISCVNLTGGSGVITIENLSKNYGDIHALKDTRLTIPEGVCFGLIGPNGAGKSTMMKILCGIIDQYDGEVKFDEMSVKEDPNWVKKNIGYVPQDIVLYEKFSAIANLSFFGEMYGLRGKALKERVEEILVLVGLEKRGKDAVKTFSGGMKRRINIGCALMHNPKYIIMDEPTVGVDPQSRNYIFEMIHKLKAENKTILYSSHYMEEVENLCEEISLIDNGQVIESGKVTDIIAKHSKPGVYVEAPGIEESMLQQFGGVLKKGEGFLIQSDQVLILVDALASWLKQESYPVLRLEIAHMSLEDIFLLLTGKTLRD